MMTKYEIRFGLIRRSDEEFGSVEYLRLTPDLVRSTVQQNGACPNHPYSGTNDFGNCAICGTKIRLL